MSDRHVLILASNLTHKRGSIVSQETLGMADDALDRFIAAGYALEHDVAPPGKKKGKVVPVGPAGERNTGGFKG